MTRGRCVVRKRCARGGPLKCTKLCLEYNRNIVQFPTKHYGGIWSSLGVSSAMEFVRRVAGIKYNYFFLDGK